MKTSESNGKFDKGENIIEELDLTHVPRNRAEHLQPG
jgi:hypothetical protein